MDLPGVVQIVPDAVKPAHDGGLRSEEGVSHPDCKDCIFLSYCLSGSDAVVAVTGFVAICLPDFPSCPELENAAYQGNGSYSGEQ